jgi:TolB protein
MRSALESLVNLGNRFMRGMGRVLAAAGAWLAKGIARFGRALWAFLGRCGLALRHLLTVFLWRPFARLTRPFARAGQRLLARFWAFLGRCGLVLRNILTALIWRPLLFVSWPLRWLYRKVLQRPFSFAMLSLRTFSVWLFREASPSAAGAFWALVAATFRTLTRGAHSRAAEWREKRTGDEYDLGDVLAPSPRRLRLRQITTAVVAAGVIVLLGLLSSQEQRALNVAAVSDSDPVTRAAVAPLVPKMTLTPTPLPSPTPTPTPSPTPIVITVAMDEVWPTPDPLSKGGSVAFSSRQNGNSDLFALALGRAAPIQLTDHPADDRDPAWSPDGRHLAFSSRRDGNWELYVLDFQSGRLNRLTKNMAFDGAPSWSPDGQWLAFESYREDNLDLYIIDSEGLNPAIRLTESPAQDFSPAWAPDGRHIAFTSWRDGNQDIYLMSLDSAFDETAINVSQTVDRNEDHPAFRPEGDLLAYHGRSDGLDLIYTVPLEDYQPDGEALSVGQGRHPSWSPDGSSLVYAHGNGDQSYIIASSVDSWNVAPQAFAGSGQIDDLAWSGVVLPQGVENRLGLDKAANRPLFQERLGENSEVSSFTLQEVDVDAPAPYLSDRVDDSFRALRQRVLGEVGWDFLGRVDNMFVFLNASPLPGDTTTNWNKAARAFDFYYRFPISVDPQVEIVREDLGSQTYWRVYIKTVKQDGSQGDPLRQLPWDFTARYDADPRYFDQGGKPKDALPSGYYLDFTALAEDYGWQRVPALPNWRTFFHGIRYWHFENRGDLEWSEAMLELYTADELAQASGQQ